MKPKLILGALLASALALVLSLFIALVVASVYPVRIGPELGQSAVPGSVISQQEMKQAEAAAKERMEKRAEKIRDQPLHIIPDIKRGALVVSWVPWFVLPFLYRVRSRYSLGLLMLLPVILVFTPLMLMSEVITFGLALVLGDVLANRVLRFKRLGSE